MKIAVQLKYYRNHWFCKSYFLDTFITVRQRSHLWHWVQRAQETVFNLLHCAFPQQTCIPLNTTAQRNSGPAGNLRSSKTLFCHPYWLSAWWRYWSGTFHTHFSSWSLTITGHCTHCTRKSWHSHVRKLCCTLGFWDHPRYPRKWSSSGFLRFLLKSNEFRFEE